MIIRLVLDSSVADGALYIPRKRGVIWIFGRLACYRFYTFKSLTAFKRLGWPPVPLLLSKPPRAARESRETHPHRILTRRERTEVKSAELTTTYSFAAHPAPNTPFSILLTIVFSAVLRKRRVLEACFTTLLSSLAA